MNQEKIMAKIRETALPGVGVRHEFKTEAGDHIGTITHRSGQRDLLIFDRKDPDACATVLRLQEEDSRMLTELLGGSQVEQNQDTVRQTVGGVVLDWLPITGTWSCANCSIQDTGLLERTGVTIVAVMRDGNLIAAPGPQFPLQPDDMAVVVGTADGIAQARSLLRTGDSSGNSASSGVAGSGVAGSGGR
jgi:TrkA domain protein